MERRRIQRSQGNYLRERQQKTNEILGMEPSMMMTMNPRTQSGRQALLVRASELPSPSQPGTFLRQFGQSDREVIENANREASVPQILAMMNGQYSQMLLMENSKLRKTIQQTAKENPGNVLDRIFITLLSRYPTADEKALLRNQLYQNGKMGIANIVWSILNTKQFIFIP